MPEEKAIKEMPRDAEVIELLKKLPRRARFLRDNCKVAPAGRLRVAGDSQE